jgi:hemolysin D
MSRTTALRHHWDVLKASWAAESERRRVRRAEQEAFEFLPAALEVLERPPRPIGRAIIWLLLTLIAAFLLWAVFGKLDIVASAQGKLVPADKVKLVQSADGGVVRAIHVRDGTHVRAGEALVELDPTSAGATEAQAQSQLVAARMAKAQAEALLLYAQTGRTTFVAPEGALPAAVAAQRQLVSAMVAEHQANLADLKERRAEAAALAAGSARQVAKLQATLPLLAERVDKRRQLAEKGYSSKLLQLELEQQRVVHERDIGVEGESLARYRALEASAAAQARALRQTFMRDAAASLTKAQDEIALAEAELVKARRQNRLQVLRAPVKGTVQQVAVATIGAVVKPADPIMVVVPDGGGLVMEANVLNKDVGRLHVGQPVAVKLEAFPFTDHSTIPGRLIQVSRDAVQDEKLGLVYLARVRLERASISVDGARVALAPGLAATADIKTGRRRIIAYLLSPLSRRAQEAGREQ